LQISVRFFTVLRELTGKKEEAIQIPECDKATLRLALRTLADLYGKNFEEYVYETGTTKVKSFLQFLINGKSTSTLKGLDTLLANGDVLAIVPPVGGG
jgi:molybdopterin synthase sulfur carrier subunit